MWSNGKCQFKYIAILNITLQIEICHTYASIEKRYINVTNYYYFHLGVYSLLWPAVYTLMAVLSYFEGTEHLHKCTLTTLHCSKVSFHQCCHMKIYNKILNKCDEYTHFCKILYIN